MKKTFKTLLENGVTWTYRPGAVYTATVGKWTINVRRATTLNKRNWRLFVTHGNGGNLAFKTQFHPTPKAARSLGVQLATEAK